MSDIHSVGIIGYGSFGALAERLLRRFCPSLEIRIFSSRFKPDRKKFFSLSDVAACDAVILTVPVHAFEETLVKILPHLRKNAVIVDVSTVKVYTVEILKRLAGTHPFIATHPMFGPESYEKKGKSVEGFRIVMTDYTISPESYAALQKFLRVCGFTIVEMSPDSHDKHLAETLFLTHLVGQIIARGEFNRTQIDSVSFGSLMDAVESVRHDGALFADVFKFNPYCKEVLQRFEKAEKEVRGIIDS